MHDLRVRSSTRTCGGGRRPNPAPPPTTPATVGPTPPPRRAPPPTARKACGYCVLVAGALALPATSNGPGSTIGLGASLGTGSRLVAGPAGSVATSLLILMSVGGFGALVASLVAPRTGRFVTCALVGSVLALGAISALVLGTRTGPAIVVLAGGSAGLALALWATRGDRSRS